MKQWRRKKIIQSAIGIVVCMSMLVESSPLLAMSYEQSQLYQPTTPSTFLPTYLKAFFALEPADAALHPALAAPASLPTPPPLAAATPSASLAPSAAAGVPEKFTAAFNKPHLQSPSLTEIPLLPDWNLVSMPTEQADTDPTAVLAGIVGDYNTVFAYDGCNPADPWQIYDPAAPPVTNDLTAVDHTIGFWIQATTDTALPVSGSVPPTTTIELCTGWNLIGMPTEQARPVRNALFSIEGKYTLVFGYNPADTEDPWELYDVNAPAWANDLQMMQPGRGYWVLATEDTTLTLANEGEPPIARLLSPDELATEITTITFITDIIGTAYSDILESWTLSYRPKGEPEWIPFATGTTPVFTDTLDQFNPTLLLNGLYEIELGVADYDGNIALAYANLVVDGNAKVGNFSLAFTDLSVSMVGLPLEVVRTYDSRDKLVGDFGVGWTLNLSDVRLEESVPPGDIWQSDLDVPGGILPFFSYCLNPSQAHVVTITFPDDTVFNFQPTISPDNCQLLVPQTIVDITYEPLPGTQGTLEPLDQSSQDLLVVGSFPPPPIDLGGGPPPGPYTPPPIQFWNQGEIALHDPALYRLTLRDGRSFVISQHDGLQSLTDLNGNTLTITENGIVHSSGKGIAFQRDELGRIVQITDPMSNTIHYNYDTHGDLIEVTDPENATTEFQYDANHYLLNIIDPRGISAVRNEYDTNGRLLRTIDAEGNITHYTLDLGDRTRIIMDRLGHQTTQHYDTDGNIIRVTNALSHTSTFTYNEDGKLLTRTDPLGHIITRTYDIYGNMLTETDPLGNVLTRTYNLYNQILTHTDNSGAITSFTYDNKGNLLTLTDPLGTTITNTYDARGDLIQVTNNAGDMTRFAYDVFGNVISQTNALGYQTTFTYDANNNLLTETSTRTDLQGNTFTLTTRRVYDRVNRVVEIIDPIGGNRLIEYSLAGNIISTIDNGYHVERVYDARGNLTRVIYPDGTEEISTYNAGNLKTSSTDRKGETTTYEYDALNRNARINFPDGSFTSKEFDPAGREIATVDENGNQTQFVYDALGRRTQIIDTLGNVITQTYDANWNLTSTENPFGHITTYEYDSAERKIRTIFADGTTERFFYDDTGQLTEIIDQNNISIRFEYDALGRLTKVINALNDETTYTYDEQGNQLTQTDAQGNTTRWAYDHLGRVISHTLPLGMSETFDYDAAGNLINQTNFNGRTITYTYNINNQIATKTFPGGDITSYTYTPNGLLATITDSLGQTVYGYDERDRLTQVVNPNGATIAYTYDNRGNRTSVTTPSATVSYTYDALNRLRSVIDVTGVTSYTYDVMSNPASVTHPNGTSTEYTYDALSRLTKLENLKSDHTVISSYDYILGPVGNRLTLTDHNGRVVDYTYDNLYRLTQEAVTDPSLGNSTTSYTYDAVGNLLTKAEDGHITNYTYDANDRLLQAGSTTYLYDDSGNITQQIRLTETITYDYDDLNRLISVVSPNHTIGYTYDDDNIRVAATYDGTSISYLVDKNRPYAQVLEERDAANSLLARYNFGLDLLSKTEGGITYYYHYDGLGNTRTLSDDNEDIVATFTYDAYGNLRAETGTTTNRYLFTGEQFDALLGAYYLRARYYNPEIGRFMTMDTFPGQQRNPLTLNRYLYTNANPVNFVDPSGNVVTLQEEQVVAVGSTYIRTTAGIYPIAGGAPVVAAPLVAPGATTSAGIVAGSLVAATGIVATGLLAKAALVAVAQTKTSVMTCAAETIVMRTSTTCNVSGYNVFLPGEDTPQTTQHIRDAILSYLPWVYLIRRPGSWDREWLKKTPECKDNYGTGSGLDCDEYPFASVWQGGEYATPRPHLRLVQGIGDNRLNGTRLGQFYDECSISEMNPLKGIFFVIPIWGPETVWSCKR